MLDLLIHYSHYSCLLYCYDIIDDDSLHCQKLLQLFSLFDSLALSYLSLNLLLLSLLSLVLLHLEICFPELKHRLLQLLLEFVDLVLPDAPNILISIGQVVFSLPSDMNFIGPALLLNEKAYLHKDLMELL